MTNTNWVIVYTTDQEYKAAIIQAVLEEGEIPSQLMNQKDTSYQFGEISIYVPSDMVISALDVIQKIPDL
jgi:hypothetical protein